MSYLLGINLSEGALYFAEKNQSFWLLDVICSHQLNKNVRAEEFQVWELKREGEGCVVTCDDGNGNIVVTQQIPFTDFPEPKAKLYFCNNVIHLPSEY